MIRTPEQGYIDGFDPEKGVQDLRMIVRQIGDQSPEDIFRYLAQRLTKLVPNLSIPFIAYEIDGQMQQEIGHSHEPNIMAAGGLAVTGTALEKQGYLRGLNKARTFSGVTFLQHAVKTARTEGEGLEEALLRDAPKLHYLNQQLELFPAVASYESTDAYWGGAYEAFAIAREVGLGKVKVMAN